MAAISICRFSRLLSLFRVAQLSFRIYSARRLVFLLGFLIRLKELTVDRALSTAWDGRMRVRPGERRGPPVALARGHRGAFRAPRALQGMRPRGAYSTTLRRQTSCFPVDGGGDDLAASSAQGGDQPVCHRGHAFVAARPGNGKVVRPNRARRRRKAPAFPRRALALRADTFPQRRVPPGRERSFPLQRQYPGRRPRPLPRARSGSVHIPPDFRAENEARPGAVAAIVHGKIAAVAGEFVNGAACRSVRRTQASVAS